MDKVVYDDTRMSFSRVSYGFGLAAVILSVLLIVIPPAGFCFGALGLLFALISKGYSKEFDKKAKTGFILSIIAMSICALVMILVVVVFIEFFDYASFIAEADSSFGELYESLFGLKPSEIFGLFFGNGGGIDV